MIMGYVEIMILFMRYDKDYLIWESTATRHPEQGFIISKEGAPEFPTTEEIIKAAHELYSFVDAK